MKKVAVIIAPDAFRDDELEMPMKALEFAGAEVTLASTQIGPAMGVLGTEVQVDTLISDLNPTNLDAIVLIGGFGAVENLIFNETLHNLVREMNDQNKTIASICSSTATLANAGVLEGRNATGFDMDEVQTAMMLGGANFQPDEQVVVDGNIITGNGPEAAGQFTATLMSTLGYISKMPMGRFH